MLEKVALFEFRLIICIMTHQGHLTLTYNSLAVNLTAGMDIRERSLENYI